MKKVIIAVLLVVAFCLAFAGPVFADPEGMPNDNASDKAVGSAWGQSQKWYNETYGPGVMGECMSAWAQNANTPGAAFDVHQNKGQPTPPGPLY